MPPVATISAPLADPAIRRLWDDCLASARAQSDPTPATDNGTTFQSPAHQPYLDLAYLDAIDRSSPGSVVLNVYGDAPDALAVAAAYTTRRGPLRLTSPAPLTPFTAVFLRDRGSFGLVCADQARRASDIRVTLPPGTPLPTWIADPETGAPTKEESGWTQTRFLTYMVALSSRDEMLSSWSENRRRTLEKHADSFRITEEQDASEIVAQLVVDSYTRHDRRPPLPVASISLLARMCRTTGLCRIFVARTRDGAPVAAVAALLGNRVASYWIAGSVPGPSMTVLLAHVFETLYSDGFVAFDFVGANTPSIAEFKRRFGGTLLPYHSIHRVSQPARALQFMHSIIRRGGA